MNPYKLKRSLVCQSKTIKEFTDDNAFLSGLFKVFLEIRNRRVEWTQKSNYALNEVFYQCIRIYNDPDPEDDLRNKYWEDTKAAFKSIDAAPIIFSMVYSVFNVMADKPAHIEYFLISLKEYLKSDKIYFPSFLNYSNQFVAEHGEQSFDLRFNPTPPSSLADGVDDWKCWKAVTNDFQQDVIIEIIDRYPLREDKLAVLEKIESAFYQDSGMNLPF